MSFSKRVAAVMTMCLAGSLAVGCAVPASDDEIGLQSNESAADELVSSSERKAVIAALREQTLRTELGGSAFLKRGDELVFLVYDVQVSGKYASIAASAMGRRKSQAGRTVDYRLRAADLLGSAYAAENALSGAQVPAVSAEALFEKVNGKYRLLSGPNAAESSDIRGALFHFGAAGELDARFDEACAELGIVRASFDR